jgi:hypothetical protein
MFQQVACGKIRKYVLNKYGVPQVRNMLCLKPQGTIVDLNLNETFSCYFPVHKCCRATDLFFYVTKIAKKTTVKGYHIRLSVCPFVCLHGPIRRPMDGFSQNLISEYFSKVFREASSVISDKNNR